MMDNTFQSRLFFTIQSADLVTIRYFQIHIFLPNSLEHYLKQQMEKFVLSEIYFYIYFCPEHAYQYHWYFTSMI